MQAGEQSQPNLLPTGCALTGLTMHFKTHFKWNLSLES